MHELIENEETFPGAFNEIKTNNRPRIHFKHENWSSYLITRSLRFSSFILYLKRGENTFGIFLLLLLPVFWALKVFCCMENSCFLSFSFVALINWNKLDHSPVWRSQKRLKVYLENPSKDPINYKSGGCFEIVFYIKRQNKFPNKDNKSYRSLSGVKTAIIQDCNLIFFLDAFKCNSLPCLLFGFVVISLI